jgi:hypothetical protein
METAPKKLFWPISWFLHIQIRICGDPIQVPNQCGSIKQQFTHNIFQIISGHLFHVGTLLEDVLDDVAGELVVGHVHHLPHAEGEHPVPVLRCPVLHQIYERKAVLRIQDVYPDPGSEFFPSRIRIKEFKYFNPKQIVS